MVTALGPHVVDHLYADGVDHRHFVKSVVRDLNCAWVNVLRAAQPNEALATALEIRRDMPLTQVMVRHRFDHLAGGDERVMKEFPKPEDYYRTICTQYLGLDVTLVAGNEIVLDWDEYGRYFEVVAELAGRDGLSLALCRTPAWHPYREHFGAFDWLGETLARWPVHKLSPNVYWCRQPEENLDALWKMLEFWEFLGKPETVIGEFSRIFNFDPHKGPHFEKISDKDAAHEMVDLTRDELAPRGIAALWYALGEWPIRASTFHTGSGFIKVVRERMGEIQISPPLAPPPGNGEGSEGDDEMFEVVTTGVPNLRLRAAPVNGAILAGLEPGTRLRVTDGVEGQIGTDVWFDVQVLDGADMGRMGFVSARFVAPVPVVPDPPPEDAEMMLTSVHLALMDALRIKCESMVIAAMDAAIAHVVQAQNRLRELRERDPGDWAESGD